MQLTDACMAADNNGQVCNTCHVMVCDEQGTEAGITAAMG